MKFNYLISTILIFCFNYSTAQSIDISPEESQLINKLYLHGVEIIGDSVYVREETAALLNDEDLRTSTYPDNYNWGVAIKHIQSNNLKLAFWDMINLYNQSDFNKDKVVKSILTYDEMFHMEKVLVATFYTYCYTDPEIGHIENGKPIVKNPHILESKLNTVREIIFYMNKYKSGLSN